MQFSSRPSTSGKCRYTASAQSYCGDGPGRFDRLYGHRGIFGNLHTCYMSDVARISFDQPRQDYLVREGRNVHRGCQRWTDEANGCPESIAGFESAKCQHHCAAGLDRPPEIWARQTVTMSQRPTMERSKELLRCRETSLCRPRVLRGNIAKICADHSAMSPQEL